MSECCEKYKVNVNLAEVEREIQALRQRIEELEQEKRELEEQVRKHARCINGLRHTIDVYQEAITSQAVAMSLLIDEDPLGD